MGKCLIYKKKIEKMFIYKESKKVDFMHVPQFPAEYTLRAE